MTEVQDYIIAVAKHTEVHKAAHLLSIEVRRLLNEEWVPVEGFSHIALKNGMGEYDHIFTQPMVK